MSMQDVGSLNAQEIGMAFRLFDPDASNSIGRTEFLKGIRGGLNAERKVLVHQIFKGLNTGGDGKIRQKDMEVKYKGADIAPMMRAFDDRGKGGIITLEEFEDEVAGGFGKVSTRLLAGESRVVSARFFGDATGRSPFVFTYGTSSPNCNNSTYAHKLHVVKAYGRCDAMPAGCAS